MTKECGRNVTLFSIDYLYEYDILVPFCLSDSKLVLDESTCPCHKETSIAGENYEQDSIVI